MSASKRPTKEQIEAEISKLQEMKPTVRQYSGFGDDHHAAIEGQIIVLDGRMSADSVYERFSDETVDDFAQNVLDEAIRASDWLCGDSDDPPSVSWLELVQ